MNKKQESIIKKKIKKKISRVKRQRNLIFTYNIYKTDLQLFFAVMTYK